jgi:hypothetical protein
LTAYNRLVTSVPTWLAVLVPLATVLAALVAGSAALLGVWLGGRAARTTAAHTASLAREDEQRRWKRERRYAAYVAFIEAVDRDLDSSTPAINIYRELVETGASSRIGDAEALLQTMRMSRAEVVKRHEDSPFSDTGIPHPLSGV